MGAFFVLRGNVVSGNRFVTNSNGRSYLIVDTAAQVNLIGAIERDQIGMSPAPVASAKLFGTGGHEVAVVGGGKLSIVFVSSSELPAQLSKRVCQVVESRTLLRVVQMVTSTSAEEQEASANPVPPLGAATARVSTHHSKSRSRSRLTSTGHPAPAPLPLRVGLPPPGTGLPEAPAPFPLRAGTSPHCTGSRAGRGSSQPPRLPLVNGHPACWPTDSTRTTAITSLVAASRLGIYDPSALHLLPSSMRRRDHN